MANEILQTDGVSAAFLGLGAANGAPGQSDIGPVMKGEAPGRTPSARRASDGEWPDDLSKLIDEAKTRALRRNFVEVEYAHALSKLAIACYGRKVGPGSAIDAAASALGVSRQALQPYGLISMCWTSEQLHEWVDRCASSGHALTPSHLLLLARLPRSLRIYWLERLVDSWADVRELRKQLRKKLPRTSE
jgi:hypothetical protein